MKGLMSVVVYSLICVTALHTTSTRQQSEQDSPPAERKFASHRFGCSQKIPQVQPREGCVGVYVILYVPRPP